MVPLTVWSAEIDPLGDWTRATCSTCCTRVTHVPDADSLSVLSFFIGSEHAQRDAEEAEKMKMDNKRQANSDTSTDPKASSPQSPKRALTASERRALEAEKRAALRQQRMRELEEDAMKAQVVIAQVKAMSATSLEALAVNSPDGDRKSSASDNELHDGSSAGGPGRRSSGSSTKST